MKTIAQQLNIKDFPFVIKDKQGNEIYYEIFGYWFKREYDSSGNIKYYENSDGTIIDMRPKDDEIVTLNGIKYQRIDE